MMIGCNIFLFNREVLRWLSGPLASIKHIARPREARWR